MAFARCFIIPSGQHDKKNKDVIALAESIGRSPEHCRSRIVVVDDSIIQATAAEKEQDMSEVGVTMAPFKYRMKW